MVRTVLRIVGGLLAAYALICVYFAMWFRLESGFEVEGVEQADIEVGGWLAIAFVLVLAPSRLKSVWRWVVTVVAAGLIWLYVSSSLISSHREQYRKRSTGRVPNVKTAFHSPYSGAYFL